MIAPQTTFRTYSRSLPSDAARSLNTHTLAYLHEVATSVSVSIEKWRIRPFLAGDGENLIADKRLLNQLFFKRLAEAETAPAEAEEERKPSFPKEVSQAAVDSVLKVIRIDIDRQRTTAKSEMVALTARVRALFRQAEDEERKYARAFALVHDADKFTSGHMENIASDVQKTLASNLWSSAAFSGEWIYLLSRLPITLSWRDARVGTDQAVTLGKFVVGFQLTRSVRLKVAAIGHGMTGNGYYHPHIATNGSPCLGDAAEKLNAMMAEYRIFDFVEGVWDLINKFNIESPYTRLDTFRPANSNIAYVINVPSVVAWEKKLLAAEAAQAVEVANPAAEAERTE